MAYFNGFVTQINVGGSWVAVFEFGLGKCSGQWSRLLQLLLLLLLLPFGVVGVAGDGLPSGTGTTPDVGGLRLLLREDHGDAADHCSRAPSCGFAQAHHIEALGRCHQRRSVGDLRCARVLPVAGGLRLLQEGYGHAGFHCFLQRRLHVVFAAGLRLSSAAFSGGIRAGTSKPWLVYEQPRSGDDFGDARVPDVGGLRLLLRDGYGHAGYHCSRAPSCGFAQAHHIKALGRCRQPRSVGDLGCARAPPVAGGLRLLRQRAMVMQGLIVFSAAPSCGICASTTRRSLVSLAFTSLRS